MADIDVRDHAVNEDNATISLGVLTAPGLSLSLQMPYSWDTSVVYTIGSINTNVVVVLEGSNDDLLWVALHSPITKTANGTFMIHHQERINYIRFRFVSEAGGAAAIITVNASPGVRS